MIFIVVFIHSVIPTIGGISRQGKEEVPHFMSG